MRIRHLIIAASCALATVLAPSLGASGAPVPAGVGGSVVTAPTLQDGDLDFSVVRLSGADRYGTAASITGRFFAPGVPVVYVASGAAFPDALSAGPAAGRASSPVLFVRPDGIPTATRMELTRLRPARIVVVGGAGAVGGTVLEALRAYTSGTVTRVAGNTRFDTSAAVSRNAFPSADIVYVSTGRNWPDALSAGAAAVVQGAPVLLSDTTSVPAVVLAEIDRLNPSRIVLVGGASAVSDTAAAQLGTIATTERVSGTDRYRTALAVSTRVFGPDRPGVAIATGLSFPDALAGVPATRHTRGPILLARPTGIPGSGELDRLTPTTAYLLGGKLSLPVDVARAAQRERGVCWAGPTLLGGSQQVLTTVPGTDSRKLAFTLDMGGNLTGATGIVDFLVANQVCTTFFPTSIMADTAEGRRVMAKIAAHPELFEVGNHTVHHCDLVNGGGGSPSSAPCARAMTQTFVRSELTLAEPVLERLSGTESRPLWRPPYGAQNAWVRPGGGRRLPGDGHVGPRHHRLGPGDDDRADRLAHDQPAAPVRGDRAGAPGRVQDRRRPAADRERPAGQRLHDDDGVRPA
ncbi:cell wall-binding repeat-containing protein [Ornithinimicrobium cerasi]|uniref:cell wall-binding repeat-containing protein n=1 Tax=Ornithinimicrobium cerasi TaxID=2248773 RepID=UPI000EFEEB0D|nr:cell wall-binding repeat-containing protein [Ornithinimicrobium cerasi]